MKFTDTLKELEAKATEGPWRKSTGNVGNGIEGYSGKKSTLYRDDGYRMVATYQSCEATGKYKQEEENQAANGELIIFLRNHAKEIINLVEAAESAMEHANFYVEADKEDDHLTRACTYGGMVSSIIDVLKPALAALNKEQS